MDPTAKFEPVVWEVPERFHVMMRDMHLPGAPAVLPPSGDVVVVVQFHSDQEVSFFLMYDGEPFYQAKHVRVRPGMLLGFDFPNVNLGQLFKDEKNE